MTLLTKRIRAVILLATSSALPFFVACCGAKTEGSAQDTEGGAKGQPDADAACADELANALHALEQASTCDTADDCELVTTRSWQLSEMSIGMGNGQVLLNKDADQQGVIEAAAALSDCGGNLGPTHEGWDGPIACEDNHCTAANHD